jgi:hypothetical protein
MVSLAFGKNNVTDRCTDPFIRAMKLGALIILASLLAAGAPSPRRPTFDRFAFDQLTITVSPDFDSRVTADSPPGSFERDYRWAAKRTGDNAHRNAEVRSIAYFDGWTRVQTFEPPWSKIQLANRHKGVVIMADMTPRTYRKYVGGDAAKLISPQGQSRYGLVATTTINGYSGSQKLKVITRYSRLPTIVFQGLPAQGRRTVTWIRTISSTGSCRQFTPTPDPGFLVVTDEYRGAFTEPEQPFFAAAHDEIIDDCRSQRIERAEPPSQKAFDRRFLFYSREAFYDFKKGRPRLSWLDIVERGHVRNLSVADWRALQIPSYYSDLCNYQPVPADCRPIPNYTKIGSKIVAHTKFTTNIWSILEARREEIVFSEHDHFRIGRLSPTGHLSETTVPTDPGKLRVTSDGTLWMAHDANARVRTAGVGYIALDGSYHEPFRFSPSAEISDLVLSNDDALVFVVADGKNESLIERRPDGSIVKRALEGLSTPSGLAGDTTSNVWLSDFATNSILKIAPDAKVRTFRLARYDNPSALAFDGKRLWFAGVRSAGYIDAAGGLHRFVVPRADSGATGNLVPLPGDRVVYPAERRLVIVSLDGTFREIRVTGEPAALLLDSHGALWYSDHETGSLRVIPDFLHALDGPQNSAS